MSNFNQQQQTQGLNVQQRSNEAQSQNLQKGSQGADLRSNEPSNLWNKDQDMSQFQGADKFRNAQDVKEGLQVPIQEKPLDSGKILQTNIDPNIKEQQLDSQKEQKDQKKGGAQGGNMLQNLNAGERKLQQQILDQKKDAVYWEQKHKELMNQPRELHHQQHILQKQQEEVQRLQREREEEDKRLQNLKQFQESSNQQKMGDIPYYDQFEQREAVTSQGVLDQGAKHYLDRPVQDALRQQQMQESQKSSGGAFIDQQHRQQLGQDWVQGIPKENLSEEQLRALKDFQPISQTGQTENWQTEKGSYQHRKDLTQEERSGTFQEQQQQRNQQQFQEQQQQRSQMRQEDRGTQEYTTGQDKGQYVGKDQNIQAQSQSSNIQWPSQQQMKQEFSESQTKGDINAGAQQNLQKSNQPSQTNLQQDNQNWGYNRQQ